MPRPLLLTGGSVVDVRTGSVAVRSVLVRDGRIAAVGDGPVAEPSTGDVDRVDVSGRWIVPGYNDMHAHTLELSDPADAFALMLTYGVTGFRQMSGSPALLERRRDGRLPDAGPALLALPGALLTPLNAGTADRARATVREQAAQGADFVKMGLVTAAVHPAAQEEANRVGIPLGGHLPSGADALAAARAGLRFVEHVGPGLGVLSSCSPDKAAIEADLLGRRGLPVPTVRFPFADKVFGALLRRIVVNPALLTRPDEIAIMRRALDTFDEDAARSVARVFAETDTWHCPTLIRERTNERGDDCALHGHSDLRFVSPGTMKLWERTARRFRKLPPATREVFRDLYAAQLRLTGILAEEGVGILAGSDVTGASWEVPGTSLHQEFDELAAAGLSPLRILQSTTVDPARFLGLDDEIGTVEIGRRADLVVLDGDPTADVANLHRVAGVVRAGTHHSRADLDATRQRLAADRRAA
ncbi:amidohydrolase family protein [Pseudonocardia endophytica]|uniref:Amidohydrolase family protein n=1 Tax=Pseudonocardia endophytica TaxID=401976 RepID=A0A4R1HYK7_PSEEN|nr:amidohydrolase family protein [Pseudonocardia endophytica]TCK26235.1 amidohydrolase family protein [Pseudonocardia endophytica]